jgi:hypothetical protein
LLADTGMLLCTRCLRPSRPDEEDGGWKVVPSTRLEVFSHELCCPGCVTGAEAAVIEAVRRYWP